MLDEISGKAPGTKEISQNKYPDEQQYKYRYEKQNVLCSFSLLSTAVKTPIFSSLLVKILLIIKERKKKAKLSQQEHLHYSHVFPGLSVE